MDFVMGYMAVRPGDILRLSSPIKAQMAAANACAGCDHYSISTDLASPDTLWINERWRTREDRAAHMVSDHMVHFNLAMQTAQIQKASIFSYVPGGKTEKLVIMNSVDAIKDHPDMVIVMGYLQTAAGEIDRLKDALLTQMAATQAEDGCMHYNFSRDVDDPNLMYIAERWHDQSALNAHMKSPHMATFNAAISGAKITAASVKSYDAAGVYTLMGA
jgi:quinol monooxygenase YgiN